MEVIRREESDKMQDMTAISYDKSRDMQEYQKKIEEFQLKNSNLE